MNNRVADALEGFRAAYTEMLLRAHALNRELTLAAGMPDTTDPRIPLIVAYVADAYRLTPAEIIGHDRHERFIEPRHIAMTFVMEFANSSLTACARYFSDRDHAGIIYAQSRVKERAQIQPAFATRLHVFREGCRKMLSELKAA